MVFNGTEYRLEDLIIDNDGIATKIKKIYISLEDDIALICFDVHQIELDINLLAYKVAEQSHGNEIDWITNFHNVPASQHRVAQFIFIKNRIC